MYRWGLGKRGSVGFYFFGAIRKYSQAANLRRSKKRLRKGQRIRGLIIRTRQYQLKLDGSRVRCWDNAGIMLKTAFRVKGSRFVGPICANVRRPRYYTLFKAVV